MKYVIVWKREFDCGILNRNGKTPSFKTEEKALEFAIKEAQTWAKNGGFRHQDAKKMEVASYSDRVHAYDTDDCRCPADNWIEYIVDKIS